MKLGIALPSRLDIGTQVAIAGDCDRDELSIWVPDERFFRDVFVTMSAVAGGTARSTIGSGVTDAQIRHPLLTATAIASVNELSNGRAILGIGAGISGFDALGIKRQSPATAIRDAINVSRRFWAGEKIDFEGKMFSAHDAHLHFAARPAPIYVAGRGPQIMAVGGELGDGIIVGHFTSQPGITHCLHHFNAGLAKRSAALGRPEIALWAYTSVSHDGRAARNAVKPAIGRTIRSTPEALGLFRMELPGLLEEIARFGYARSVEYDHAMWTAVPDELALHLSVSGTPRECVEQLRAIHACGVDHVIALPYPAEGMSPEAMIALLREQVIPHVREL